MITLLSDIVKSEKENGADGKFPPAPFPYGE